MKVEVACKRYDNIKCFQKHILTEYKNSYTTFDEVMCVWRQSAVVRQNNGWIIAAEHIGKFLAPKFGL